MMQSTHVPIEEMELFAKYVEIADRCWEVVQGWEELARDTVGKQLIRAADSVGANLVDGDGRYTDADSLHFCVIARASARETRLWLKRAIARGLMDSAATDSMLCELASATQMLNALIRYRRRRPPSSRVREARPLYVSSGEDPFAIDLLTDD